MSDVAKLGELHANAQQVGFEFLMADIELCTTFADVAVTELNMGDRSAAERVFLKAEDGYASVGRLLLHLADQKREEVQRQLRGLRTILDQVGNRLGSTDIRHQNP